LSTKILCIESSTDICSVCISVNGKSVGLKEFKDFKHSSHLLPLILNSLEESDIDKKSLHSICLSKGPGSYTGLRVGSSTAKGLAFALDIPLIAIDTLKALANGLITNIGLNDNDVIVMPMIDARRDEVYTAKYSTSLDCILPIQPLILDHFFLDHLDHHHRIYLCGNGVQKATSICEGHSNVMILPTQCSAQDLCSLSQLAYDQNLFETLDHFEPNYLKPPKITKPKSPLI